MKVEISKNAKKHLKKVPNFIQIKLTAWVTMVESFGLEEIRKISSFHDEPLKGQRKGQRSIRLNRSYRAIYILKADNSIEFISVEEVHKHDY